MSITKIILVVFLLVLLLGWFLLAHHYYNKVVEYSQTFWKGEIHEKYVLLVAEAFFLLCLVMVTFIVMALAVVIS